MRDEGEIEEEIPEEWIAECRQRISVYLAAQGVKHGAIGEAPAWAVYPYVAIWAIKSWKAPGWVGWWVICGDCPTDFTTCTGDRTPRSAVEEFAARWREGAAAMMRGDQIPDWSVGNSENALELAPLLASRAELLAEWGRDDGLWE
jgi:hypothetical protein